LEEEEVKRVIGAYFRQRNIKAARQKGPGPDFLCEGVAIETKPTDVDFDRAFDQYVSYAFKYAGLWIVLPEDAIDTRSFVRLYLMDQVLSKKYSRQVKLYIVAKRTEAEYHVREFSISDFFLEAAVQTAASFPSQYEVEPDDAIPQIISRLSDPDMEIGSAISRMVKDHYYSTKISF